MSGPKKDPSGKKTVKKRIVKKIIKKKKTGTVDGASQKSADTGSADKPKPRRRIIKRRAATRKFSKEALEEVLGKKLDKKEVEEEENTPSSAPAVKEEKASPAPEKSKGSPRKIRRRRVVKKRPAIKKVIKKKAVTRRLARETVEQVLGKKLAEAKKEEPPKVKEKPPAPKKPPVEVKKEEKVYATQEIPKPPRVVIPDDWKEKKISSHQKKSDKLPDIKPFPLVEGTELDGRYKVIDCVHSDCYGAVYKSEHKEKENKLLAIKEIVYVLKSDESKGVLDDIVSGLKKMVTFLQDVEHPNLAKIEDYFFQVDDKCVRFFVVMEFVEGYTLNTILQENLKKNKSISAKSIFKYMTKICDALYYLHNRKPFPIAFGDLKPSNVIVTSDGQVKCINYGMARLGDTLSQFRGTLGYSAPEHTGVDFTNTKADIFSFGVTLYYLLSGINPEEYPYEFKPIKDKKPFISDKVEEFVFKCIKITPDDRPNIDDVKKTIEGFDFFELDTSTEEEEHKEEEVRKIEEKKKEISTTKAAVVEPVEDIMDDIPDEPEQESFFKSKLFKIGIVVLFLIIGIIVIIVLGQQ